MIHHVQSGVLQLESFRHLYSGFIHGIREKVSNWRTEETNLGMAVQTPPCSRPYGEWGPAFLPQLQQYRPSQTGVWGRLAHLLGHLSSDRYPWLVCCPPKLGDPVSITVFARDEIHTWCVHILVAHTIWLYHMTHMTLPFANHDAWLVLLMIWNTFCVVWNRWTGSFLA